MSREDNDTCYTWRSGGGINDNQKLQGISFTLDNTVHHPGKDPCSLCLRQAFKSILRILLGPDQVGDLVAEPFLVVRFAKQDLAGGISQMDPQMNCLWSRSAR